MSSNHSPVSLHREEVVVLQQSHLSEWSRSMSMDLSRLSNLPDIFYLKHNSPSAFTPGFSSIIFPPFFANVESGSRTVGFSLSRPIISRLFCRVLTYFAIFLTSKTRAAATGTVLVKRLRSRAVPTVLAIEGRKIDMASEEQELVTGAFCIYC